MVLENWIFKDFFNSYKNYQPPLGPHPTPGDHDLNKIGFTLFEDAYTQVFSLYIPYIKCNPIVVYPASGDLDFHN